MKKTIILSIIAALFVQCGGRKANESNDQETGKLYSIMMAESVMDRNPEAWNVDYQTRPKWGYVQGLVSKAILQVWEKTGDKKFFEYVKNGYADALIDSTGNIIGYKMEDFNIDKINSGKMLFTLYDETGDERYRKTIEILREQLRGHPRVSEGGFWHKKIYTNQMWLDGLYMGSPFYAQYVKTYGDPSNYDDITNQFLLIEKYLKDEETGLYYHGWDESKSIFWADPETGLSKNFWGRGIGWFYMAIVDVLDFLPETHPDRDKLVSIFGDLTDAIISFQQDDSGLWYQVMDMPDQEGNYLEATCASMFTYGMFKGIKKGILGETYLEPAMKAYNGILKNFIVTDDKGNLEITSCCAGAGLGPEDNTRRDGTYEYYISETIRSNDGKAIGPFIMGSLLIEENPEWSSLID